MCLFCLMDFMVESFETVENFQLQGGKWGGNQGLGFSGDIVTYSFATRNIPGQFENFDSFLTDVSFQREVTQSFAAWENVADIRFQLVPDSGSVDIRLGWGNIDGGGGILGQTTVPSFGALSDVVIILDVDEDWFLNGDAPPENIDFSATVTHQIGHAIGIGHSQKSQALMNATYSRTILDLQNDDKDAAIEIYGENDLNKIEIFRFFNPNAGGHFFTPDGLEKTTVENSNIFSLEGIGFHAIAKNQIQEPDLMPVYRFLNSFSGSHLFTAFEKEKDHLITNTDFVFEGVAFKAFASESSATASVHRFFNTEIGGHFFTANAFEMEIVSNMSQFRYEGTAFYAYTDVEL